MKGVVTSVLPNKGFGFIRGEDGYSRFFNATQVEPLRDFDQMHEGRAVEFEPATSEKGNGLRAVQVRLCS